MRQAESKAEKTGVLSGIRIVELGNFIAAPTAGRLLAEFGAEVIKVEHPGKGDETRSWRAHGLATSLFFRHLARNKRSVTIDLRTPAGQTVARKLIASADVLLENFRPGTLERWQLAPDTLRADNPALIVVRISGFGQTGPYARRAGFGGVAEAMSGLQHLTGRQGEPPVRVGVSLGDQVAALYAVMGTLLGLLERQKSGATRAPGETVDVALTEAMLSLMESIVPDYDAFGVIPEPTGSEISSAAPSSSYPCSDGAYVAIGGNGDALFPRLMDAIGHPELRDAPDLATNAGRVRRRTELNAAIADWTRTRTAAEVVQALEAHSVPCGKCYDAADIAHDPQYAARGMLLRLLVDTGHGVRPVAFAGVVPKLERQPGRVRHLAPEVGADTDAVLQALGYDAATIAALRQQGVL